MIVSSLRNRNVTIGGRRTSMKLEPGMWDALDEICCREGTAIHDICTRVAKQHKGCNLTAATRAFVLAYFRAAATEEGHLAAGHGGLVEQPGKIPPAQNIAATALVASGGNLVSLRRRFARS